MDKTVYRKGYTQDGTEVILVESKWDGLPPTWSIYTIKLEPIFYTTSVKSVLLEWDSLTSRKILGKTVRYGWPLRPWTRSNKI